MNIYVASSWRNEGYPAVVAALRAAGHEVYDFRNPGPDNYGFSWSSIDPDWKSWTPEQYREALTHPLADKGYGFDIRALDACDACVLVLPCGRSAHLELGYAAGQGKRTYVLLAPNQEPELMVKMCTGLAADMAELVQMLKEPGRSPEVLILSGVPGSGKSTYAKKFPMATICSADDYHVIDGVYRFDITKANDGHADCFKRYLRALYSDVPLVIVDNTNISVDEISPYVLAAQARGSKIKMATFYGDRNEFAARNVHWVPAEVIERMHTKLLARRIPPYWKVTQYTYIDGVRSSELTYT